MADDTYKVRHYFGGENDGWTPEAALVFDGNGNLYGTTAVVTDVYLMTDRFSIFRFLAFLKFLWD